MMKRFVVSIIVASTLLFTVGFQSPVNAASGYSANQDTQAEVELDLSELLNGEYNVQGFNAIQKYMQQYFLPFDRSEQTPVEEPEVPQENDQTEEQPSQEEEQNKTTQPNQREQQPAQQAPEQTEQQTEQGQLSQFEQEVIELTNVERSKQGLAPLQTDVELSAVARDKSKDMQTRNYFDHTSPTYGSPFDMMRSYGISYQAAGENIAKGQRSPQEVVNAWMNSQGHRENILNGNFTHIGVGFVEQGNYWTQMFIGK